MKWFQGITTLKELRKEYRRLVVKHHPDNGGSEDVIKEINERQIGYWRQIYTKPVADC